MKNIYLLSSIVIFLTSLSLSGQSIIPINGNPILGNTIPDPNQQIIEFRQATTCEIEEEGLTYLASGERLIIPIGIDTVGLDSNQVAGSYACIQCNNSPFGTALIQGDTLIYQANENVQSGFHEFSIQYEDELGSRTAFFNFVIRRAGSNLFFSEISLMPEESITIEADISGLSGQLVCSALLNCSESYDGRDQEIRFSRTDSPDNIFTYTASRFGGVDSVCLVLCNQVATCDTFNYSFRILQSAIEELPIFDDFSYPGPFPDSTIWLEDDPYINRQMAINPPSFGVATFDGLDKSGVPYGGGYGVADRLTSKAIRMDQYQDDLVVLSYWLQRTGLGNKPEVEDSMVVEFKNQFGAWELIRSLEGIPFNVPNSVLDTFKVYRDTVSDSFKHNNFQFRFVSYSDRTGVLDNWHLDYVRLDNSGIETFEDIAFGNEPGFILQPYSSMPYAHFIGNTSRDTLLIDTLRVQVRNFANTTLQAQSSKLRITEQATGTSILGDNAPTLLNEALADINPLFPVDSSFSFITDPPYSNAYPSLRSGISNESSFLGKDLLTFDLSYEFVGADQVPENDFIVTSTIFDNYFSYDDGTAEAGFIAQQNNSIAVKFTSYIEDSLRAIRIHFPVTTIDASDQVFDLRVYLEDLNTAPVYEALSLPVLYTSSFYDTLQGFTTYPLVDLQGLITPVYLPAGKDFFVSWTQVAPCEEFECIPVGFDRNTTGGRDEIWANLTGEWKKLDDALVARIPDGSLMLRAVVGDVTPFATSTRKLAPAEAALRIYPNPGEGLFNINLANEQLNHFNYLLFNAFGQQIDSGTLQSELDFSDLSNGMYILKCINPKNNTQYTNRIIIQK